MKYAHYEVEDFLTDPEFIEWVRQPTPPKNQFWQTFLRDHPGQQRPVQQARSVLLGLRFDEEPVPDALVQAEWARFRRNQAEPSADEAAVPVVPLRPVRYAWWAAAAVVGLLVGWLWYTNQPVHDTVYRTAYGQQRSIRLPDGSAVTLNANSELRLPGDWSRHSDREVWLKGEGFFNVVKRPNQAQTGFVVHTGELDVQVLGTAFNVKSRRQEADVLLQTGSVRLRTAKADTARSLLMRPGDGVRYRPATGQLERRQVRPDQMATWTRGVLLLDHMTLGELGQVIEDTYGRRVVIRSPKLAGRALSGSLPTRSERALLEGIAVTLNVPMRVEENVVVFGE